VIDGDVKNYSAILVDTSIFDSNGLRLAKGLLGKLSQFKRSPIEYLFPDVIKNEVKKHLEEKIKVSKAGLEKALNDAGDYLFFEGIELDKAKAILIEGKEIEGLSEKMILQFIKDTGALILETGRYVTVSELLSSYFLNKPPFAESGKKKHEFPDAIVLFAVESWAKSNNGIRVLAVAKDNDWKAYCDKSKFIDYTEDLSNALSLFNKVNAPYEFIKKLEAALEKKDAAFFISGVESKLYDVFDGFTPDQEADSYLYWEPEGCYGWFNEFEFIDNKFQVIEIDEENIVIGTTAKIKVEAEGEFSLSMYDSIDKDHIYMGGITANATEEFESELLITIVGDLNDDLSKLVIDKVEVVNPISSIDFGMIEPDYYDEYE
jgi:hypothetical protein